MCRPAFAIFLLIGIIAFIISVRFRFSPFKTFLITYVTATILFFASAIPQGGGLPAVTATRQEEFLALKGTRFPLDRLDPSIWSFLNVLPQSFINTFLRPFPGEAKGALQLLASAEIIIFWAILLWVIINRNEYWKLRLNNPVILLLLFVGTSVYISVGYIVPFPGAIIRYKAAAEIMIITGLISLKKPGFKLNWDNL